MLITTFLIKAVGNEVKIKNFSGFYVRDFFLTTLEEYNPRLTSMLHPAGMPALYSTSPLLTPFKKGLKPVYRKTKGPVIYAKITVLREEPVTQILNAISQKNELVLDESKIALTSISVSSTLLPEEPTSNKPIRRFIIYFKTPCLFKRKNKQSPYHPPIPNPKVIFGNLTRIWNSISEKHIPNEFLRWIDNNGISIITMKVKTKKVHEHSDAAKLVKAFTGQTLFQVNDKTDTKQYARITNTLLKLAEYTNIGRNRTAGFGMIGYKEKTNGET